MDDPRFGEVMRERDPRNSEEMREREKKFKILARKILDQWLEIQIIEGLYNVSKYSQQND